jgi:hypothetical protein
VPLYEGLVHGGSSVEEGVELPSIVLSGLLLGGSLGGDRVDG